MYPAYILIHHCYQSSHLSLIASNLIMILFIALLYFFVTAATALNLSLCEQKRWSAASAGVIIVAALASSSAAASLGILQIKGMLNNHALLTDMCILLFIEALAGILSGSRLINAHFNPNAPSSWLRQLWLIPSPTMLYMNTALLAIALYQIPTLSFETSAVLFGALLAMLLLALSWLTRVVIRHWSQRIQLKAALCLVQIALAMFVPLLSQPSPPVTPILPTTVQNTLYPLLALLIPVLCGFCVYLFLPLERLPRAWRHLLRVCS
jgi:hypothetical protein